MCIIFRWPYGMPKVLSASQESIFFTSALHLTYGLPYSLEDFRRIALKFYWLGYRISPHFHSTVLTRIQDFLRTFTQRYWLHIIQLLMCHDTTVAWKCFGLEENSQLWYFLCRKPEQTVKQTKLPINWSTMTTLMWRQCQGWPQDATEIESIYRVLCKTACLHAHPADIFDAVLNIFKVLYSSFTSRAPWLLNWSLLDIRFWKMPE